MFSPIESDRDRLNNNKRIRCSFQATITTVIASILWIFLVFYFKNITFVIFSLVLSCLMLLRSPESMRFSIRTFRRWQSVFIINSKNLPDLSYRMPAVTTLFLLWAVSIVVGYVSLHASFFALRFFDLKLNVWLSLAIAGSQGFIISTTLGGFGVLVVGFRPGWRWIVGEPKFQDWLILTTILFLGSIISVLLFLIDKKISHIDAFVICIGSAIVSIIFPILARLQRSTDTPGRYQTGAMFASLAIRIISTVKYIHKGWRYIALNFDRVIFRVRILDRAEFIPGWRPKHSPFSVLKLDEKIHEHTANRAYIALLVAYITRSLWYIIASIYRFNLKMIAPYIAFFVSFSPLQAKIALTDHSIESIDNKVRKSISSIIPFILIIGLMISMLFYSFPIFQQTLIAQRTNYPTEQNLYTILYSMIISAQIIWRDLRLSPFEWMSTFNLIIAPIIWYFCWQRTLDWRLSKKHGISSRIYGSVFWKINVAYWGRFVFSWVNLVLLGFYVFLVAAHLGCFLRFGGIVEDIFRWIYGDRFIEFCPRGPAASIFADLFSPG